MYDYRRRDDLGYIMGLVAVLMVILFFYGVFSALEKQQQTTGPKPALTAKAATEAPTAEAKHVFGEDVQPKTILFYSSNTLFEGARISIKNADGQIMWFQMPEEPMIKRYSFDYHLTGFSKSFAVPAAFDLTRGFQMVIHFKDGHATRFQPFKHIGDGWWDEPSFYLHVCEGLRPHVYLNWVPDGEKHPVTEPATSWENFRR